MAHYPNVAVKVMIRCQDKIMMLKHHANGAYDFPGGRMEWGESPEETLSRELQEEINYAPPTPPQFFGIWNYIAEDKSRHSIFLYYFLEVPERPTFEGMAEQADVIWLDKQWYLDRFDDDARVERMFSSKPV